MHRGFWWENLNDGNRLEDQGVDGIIIIKLTVKEWGGGSMDWICLAQDIDSSDSTTSLSIKCGEFLD